MPVAATNAISPSGFVAREPKDPREDPSGVVPTPVADMDRTSGDDDWMDARTVLGAPSFAVLAAERAAVDRASSEVVRRPAESTPVRGPVERTPVDSPLDSPVETLDVPTGSPMDAPTTVSARDALDAALESLTTQADAPSFSSLEIPIDVDEPELLALEVSIAPQSESAIWEGLDGELGVFLATYDELPLGTEVMLTLHLTGERPFVSRARVVWLRNAPGVWPGLGLRLLENRPDVWFRLQRFSQRWRAPMFHCE